MGLDFKRYLRERTLQILLEKRLTLPTKLVYFRFLDPEIMLFGILLDLLESNGTQQATSLVKREEYAPYITGALKYADISGATRVIAFIQGLS